jgi:hypothetical protein
LRSSGKAAEFAFTHSRLHDEGRSHEAGWTEALDKLERHFLTLKGDIHDHA